MLLVFLLHVVVGGESGPRRRDQAPQRDSTPSDLEEFGEYLEEEERRRKRRGGGRGGGGEEEEEEVRSNI